MRILYISQYFPPEVGATQSRAHAMARGLVQAGHRVTMLTEFPNHPTGVIPPGYRGKLFERDTLDGIDILRVRVLASPRPGFVRRMLFYLSFMVMAAFAGVAVARGRFDVVYVTSPPLFAGASALVVRALRRIPMVMEVRDLWPESAVQLGELREGFACRMAERLEAACYRHSRRVVAVTEGIRTALQEKGVPDARIISIPNGADTDLFRPHSRAKRREECPLDLEPDDFAVVYTGLHGLAHGLETIQDAAEILREERTIRFVFVGSGPRKAALVERARGRGLDQVSFFDEVPEADLPHILARADVGIDTRRKLGITTGTLPAKMFSYMACECPVLLAIEGEAAEMLAGARAGVAVPPEDPEALAGAILRLRSDAERRVRLGKNGREFVLKHHSRSALARKLESVLREETGF
ncbi:MAG: glycosyltransferase family 4 protein [Gemmatimonadota bacterium]|nr:glycosyltransferase family 4 protein [Gemmatimonadota bacterium]MDP6529453.1 glycosyltransferase family 4 protein [Gemmatimonadota bacterium]MDP7030744.1 glycosyltransferase family 4 protein [Gemmatimonadota bacterium]